MDQTAALSNLTAQSIKVAAAYKAKAEKAPRPADPDVLEKAAAAMVRSQWIDPSQLDNARRVLGDPTEALKTLTELSVKSAEVIEDLKQKLGLATGRDPRLASGTAVGDKAAAAPTEYVGTRPETEADRLWAEKMASYRQQINEGVA